jgi:AMP deaminase
MSLGAISIMLFSGHCCAALQDNLLHGRFLAELTKEVFHDLEETKYQHTEYRISIYGRKPVEWDILAAWVCQNKLYSDKNVWLIQVCSAQASVRSCLHQAPGSQRAKASAQASCICSATL